MEQKRALVVEEGHNDLSALQRLLMKKGYHVHFSETAPEALKYAASHPVDLILTREKLGEESGAVLIAQLREMNVQAPAILYGTPADGEKLDHVPGQRAFVPESLKDEKLEARVGQLLSKFAVAQPAEQWRDELAGERLVAAGRSVQ